MINRVHITEMKYFLARSLLAGLPEGCAIVPFASGDRSGGYLQERNYNRGNDSDRDRYFHQGDWNHADFNYRFG